MGLSVSQKAFLRNDDVNYQHDYYNHYNYYYHHDYHDHYYHYNDDYNKFCNFHYNSCYKQFNHDFRSVGRSIANRNQEILAS